MCQRFQDKNLNMDERLGALKLYRRHLVEQYSDRCAFWSLKDVSGDLLSRTVCITTDGADQAPQLIHVHFVFREGQACTHIYYVVIISIICAYQLLFGFEKKTLSSSHHTQHTCVFSMRQNMQFPEILVCWLHTELKRCNGHV